uniref:NADH-ubiquinone oxidoreductase chain 5 n=1 Tax=Archichauliodes deceptor TaxID=1909206 RepID=A0A343A2U9_9NEOP|nr:NADH dehydrogenase subunit 5 [Archichauliodes deceptor]AOX48543.1 NADH dehydrogenase subunit 5 [Archichauliodes deceptor]
MCLIGSYSLMLVSLILFFNGFMFIFKEMVIFIEWEILSLNSSSIVMTILMDWMSLLFMSFVLFISSVVIYYSKGYMEGDYNINRFILLVLLFVLSMMFLIISPNLISILLGWDGLGLVSYVLVIYYQNVKSYNAGMLTALSNRIGDVALLMAIAWMMNYGSWNYIFYLECMKNSFEMEIICVMVILAGMTKSAQIPFSSWLPAAMAAPTPVSALVHSSTLVTAGVYLLIRFNVLMSGTGYGDFMLMIGVLTMFMAGLGANFEFDLKKIIALSTLSQLGLMMSILSMGFPILAYYHLLTHALFKALLFMCAGAVIHNMMNSQDIRFMGSLVNQMPLTISCMNIANLALCGTPFLAGFYSKDLILEMVSLSYLNVFIFILYFLSTGLTVCYSFRLVYYSMIGDFNLSSCHPMSDEQWSMLMGMLGLVFLAIFGGSMLSWMIFPTPIMICLPIYMKLLALVVSVLGAWMGYEMSCINLVWSSNSMVYYEYVVFFGSMWFMPILSTKFVNYLFLKMGVFYSKNLDQGWSELLGGQGMYNFLSYSSSKNEILQFNNLKIYLLSFIMWIFILIMFLFL